MIRLAKFLVPAFIVLAALLLCFQVAVVPTCSMERTVLVGDHLLVNRLAYEWKDVKRGDVISFHPPTQTSDVYLKRVIATGGDSVEFRGDRVLVNGDALPDQCIQGPKQKGRIVVPAGELYVLGDNRNQSEDSRYWGTVPRKNVIGAPVVVLWSFAVPTNEWLRGSAINIYLRHPLERIRWTRFFHSIQ